MAYYLIQLSYTPEAWAAQLAEPKDRREIVRPLFDVLNGQIESAFFALGPYDVVLIAKLPDNVSAAALSLTLTTGGSVRALQTTPLLPIEEGIEAMRRAAAAATVYQPPHDREGLLATLAAFEEGP